MISKDRETDFGIGFTRAEVEAWHRLCRALVEVGAVTEADLKKRATDMDTPGCVLFSLIRGWADLYAGLVVSQAEAKFDKLMRAAVAEDLPAIRKALEKFKD